MDSSWGTSTAFTALIGLGSIVQGCAGPVDRDHGERIRTVAQAVDPGTYRFHLSDDSVLGFNEYYVWVGPPMGWVPHKHSMTLSHGQTPYPYFDLALDGDGTVTGATTIGGGPPPLPTFPTLPPTILETQCLGSGFDTATLYFIGSDPDGSVVDPGNGTIEVDFQAIIVFAEQSVPANNCATDPFIIETAGLLNDPSGCGGNNLGSTEFCLDGAGFTIPEVAPSCGAAGSCLDLAYELGGTEPEIVLHGHTDPEIEP